MKNLPTIAILAIVLPCHSSGAEPKGSPVEPPPTEPIPRISANSPNVIAPVLQKPVSKSRILSLYHQLQAGQTRSNVEEILGKPVTGSTIVNGSEQWYVNETERRNFEGSPWGYAGIRVFYDKEDRLISATFNSQYVKAKHIDRYLKKYGERAEQRRR